MYHGLVRRSLGPPPFLDVAAAWQRYVGQTAVVLPAHIADQIARIVATTLPASFHIDSEAAKYGGVALMGTIGTIWILRPDGTFWDVDDDWGKPLTPLAPEWHHAALVCGAERYPWLVELIPPRPADAVSCESCTGVGFIGVHGASEKGMLCPDCHVRGWNPAS